MRVMYFYKGDNIKKPGLKHYGIIILNDKEMALLDKLGGFSSKAKTFYQNESFKLPNKTGFIFNGFIPDLDKIRDELKEKLGCQCNFKNILCMATHEALLAKEHRVKEIGFKIYLNAEVSKMSHVKTKFYATFRAETKEITAAFLEACKNWHYWVGVRHGSDAITIWGCPSGLKNAINLFNTMKGTKYSVVEKQDPGRAKLLLREYI